MQGKRPTVRQKKLMIAAGFDPKEWLVVRETDISLSIRNRETGNFEIIVKGDYL